MDKRKTIEFPVLTLTPQRFRAYGRMIHYPNKGKKSPRHNLFRIVLAESGKHGWRIAYLIVRDKKIFRLEQHPRSFESFEPVRGRGLLFVSRSQDLHAIRCFYLDQPVIVHKGIWHGVRTLGREMEIKLTENSLVKCVYWQLPHVLK